jgi:predicted transcriptional regulator
MIITIDLPEDTAATLNERARAEGRPIAELATEAVTDRYGCFDEEEFPLDADAVKKIRRGLAEVDAGQTMSLEKARADLKAAFATRYGNASA